MNLPTSLKNKKEWLIVGPMGPFVATTLNHLPVLAVDGGANFCEKIDVWVGDKDSLQGEISAGIIFQHPQKKDQSDFALGLQTLNLEGPLILHLWGFDGGRMDHFLFNLGEIDHFLKEKQDVKILFYNLDGDISFVFFSRGEWNISHQGLFSLGVLKSSFLSLKGKCDYPLEQKTLLNPLSSHGLSNFARGEIIVSSEEAFFLYLKEEK